MNFSGFMVDHETQAKVYVVALPESLELEEMIPVPVHCDEFTPSELITAAWYTQLKQGIDPRAGYTPSNPSMFDEPKGGTATYFFEIANHRISYEVFERARRSLSQADRDHLLEVAQDRARPKLRVLFKLWIAFGIEWDAYETRKKRGWI